MIDEGSVLLIWRHRFATNTWGWEIPAGWSDDDEDPTTAIRREIEEETGYRVRTVAPLTTYQPMSGISSQRYQLFLGHGATLVGPHENAEASRVEWLPIDRVPDLLTEGSIPDGPSMTGLAFYLATR